MRYPDRTKLRPLLAGAIALIACYCSTAMDRLIGGQPMPSGQKLGPRRRYFRRQRTHERYRSAQTVMQLPPYTEQQQAQMQLLILIQQLPTRSTPAVHLPFPTVSRAGA